MKLPLITKILLAGALVIPAAAQDDHPQPPGVGGGSATVSSDDSAATPDSTLQPQDTLNAYDEQMVAVTLQTSAELAQIAEQFRAGHMSSDEAEHLTRSCYELGVIRLQFLDTLHLILATHVSNEGSSAKPDEQTPQVKTAEDTLVVAPPDSSPDIPESMARYLELTPVQIANIQARVNEEQKRIQPLMQRLSQNRKALTSATEMTGSSDGRIRKLAVEQSHILEQLIIANSRLQQEIYQVLTAAQRKKLDGIGQDTADVTKRLFAEK